MIDYSMFMTVKSPDEIIFDTQDGNTPREELSLAHAPQATSFLVKSSRKDILQKINLEEMFGNLNNCVPLLNITYNAVVGTGLSKTVTTIKDQFSVTLSSSITVMTGFKAGTEDAVLNFLKAYKFLTDPKYAKLPADKNGITQACAVIEKIRQKAVTMQGDASKLAATFEQIEKTAQDVTKEIMNERDIDYKQKQEMESNLNVLNSQVQALKEVKEDLDDEITEYGEQYNKLSRQIEKNEERAFSLALTSAILGGIGAIFGGSGTPQPQQPSSGGNGTAPAGEGNAETKKKLEDSQKNTASYEARIAEIDKELAEIKPQIEKETDNDKKKELSDKQDALEREKIETQRKLDASKGQEATYKGILSGISSGLQQTSEKLGQMSEKMDDKTESMYTRLDNIAKQKAAVSKERRQTIQQLAQMTSQIANATTEARDLNMVYNALVMAIGCMRIVKVYLSDIELFWKNVAKFCERLIEGVTDIRDNVKALEGVDDYIVFFTDKDFVMLYLINLANWVALNTVSIEYLEAFNKTRETYNKEELNAEENPDPKVHWQRAKATAQSLQEQFKIELKAEGV